METTRRREIEIPAIGDAELREVLRAYNLHGAVESGSMTCRSCGKTTGWDEIGALIVEGDTLRIVCNRPGCIEGVATGIHD
jgi:hypothetical protein